MRMPASLAWSKRIWYQMQVSPPRVWTFSWARLAPCSGMYVPALSLSLSLSLRLPLSCRANSTRPFCGQCRLSDLFPATFTALHRYHARDGCWPRFCRPRITLGDCPLDPTSRQCQDTRKDRMRWQTSQIESESNGERRSEKERG